MVENRPSNGLKSAKVTCVSRSGNQMRLHYWSGITAFFAEVSAIAGTIFACTEEPFNSFTHFALDALQRSVVAFVFIGVPSLCFAAVAALIGALEFPEWWLPLRKAAIVALPFVLLWCLALLCSCTEVSGFWFRTPTPAWTHFDFWDTIASFWWLPVMFLSGLGWWLYSIFRLPADQVATQ